jgi:D-amino peptidase
MEGVAGIVDWSQCRGPGQPYEEGRRLLLGEVNAAIAGAVAGGATEIICNDSHGTMNNLDPAALGGQATYVSGRHKPLYMMQGLDATADVAFLVGYHGSISGASSVLSHTYNPAVISLVELNGVPAGESGINALVALGHGVPVGLITGDQETISQTEPFLPDGERVVVKESFTRFGATSLHPEAARAAIAKGAQRAVQRAASMRPPAISLPATLDVHVQTADMAEVASWVRGVERTGTRTVRIRGDDPLAIFRAFVGVTYITRVSEGRLGGRAGGGACHLALAPVGDGGVQVQRERHRARGELGVPVLGGHPPHHLELDAARVLGVQRLGHAVIALPHQGPGLMQPGPRLDQVSQRADLPGQVVEPRAIGMIGGLAHSDVEQAEVVIVDRARRAQERGAARDLGADLEAERARVEVDLAVQAVHVQHRVVETADGHLRFLPLRDLPPGAIPGGRRSFPGAA